MGDTRTGVKAGLVAGIIYGVVLGILSYITVTAEKAQIVAAIASKLPADSPFTANQLYGIVVLLTPGIAAIGGILGGLIVGAIYGRLFDRIPGKTSLIKGVLVGMVLWIILSVLTDLDNLQYGVSVYLEDVAVGLFSAMLFGVLLGYFFGRFTRPKDPAVYGYPEGAASLSRRDSRAATDL